MEAGRSTSTLLARVLVCGLVVGLAIGTLTAGALFPSPIFKVGDRPNSVAIGDFDNDGNRDLVVTNWDFRDISVLLGDGDGSFAEQIRYPVGSYPTSVSIGDFNGDGKQDFAVTNYYSDDISVLLGNGDGSFAAQIRYPAGRRPYSIARGDFDGDGSQDFAVANYYSDDVSVLLGHGDGSFAEQIRYPTGDSPISLAIATTAGRTSWSRITTTTTSRCCSATEMAASRQRPATRRAPVPEPFPSETSIAMTDRIWRW
jgi:hypothetical protein